MVIGRMCVRGSSGGKVKGSRAVSSLADFLTTGGGHTTIGAAKAPQGANSCFIRAPLPVLGGSGVHFNGGSSLGCALLGLARKAFSVSPWIDVSIGVTSFEPCSSGHNDASGWSATTAAASGDMATASRDTATVSGDTATVSGDTATVSGDTATASGDTV